MLSASRIGLRQSSRVLTEEASLVRVGRLHSNLWWAELPFLPDLPDT